MPAYNAEKTLQETFEAIPSYLQQNVIVVDDKSTDKTVKIAKDLNLKIYQHEKNQGYGGNQKTCYEKAIYDEKADIIVMLHPDYQYPPELIPAMVSMIEYGGYDVCLGSRVLCGQARKGNMPWYKYLANRFLTFAENILTGAKLSEYHTGFRAYRKEVVEKINFQKNSDDFIFDNQFLLQVMAKGYKIGEISSPCRYFAEASSINIVRSAKYGLECLYWGLIFFFGRLSIYRHPLLYPINNKVKK